MQRDRLLLKQLRGASGDASITPSQLLSRGEELLHKADSIKGFLSKQRKRTDTTATAAQWRLASQQLSKECDATEKQLVQSLQQSISRIPELVPELGPLLQELSDSASHARAVQHQLFSQASGIQSVVRSIQSYGLSNINDAEGTVAAVRQELAALQEDVHAELALLSEEACAMEAEVGACRHPADAARRTCSDAGDGSAYETAGFSGQSNSSEASLISRTTDVSASGPSADTSSSMASSRRCSDAGQSVSSQQRADEELERMVALHPLAASSGKESVRAAYLALQEAHLERVRAWQQEAACSSGREHAALTGGWPKDQHLLFVRLREMCFKQVGPRGGKEAVLQKLAQMMPGHTMRKVAEHETWFCAHRLLQRRHKDIMESWQRQRSSFMADSQQLLAESAALAAAQAECAGERLAWQAAGQQLHGQLAELRALKATEQEEEAALLAAQQQAEAVIQQGLDAQRKAEAAAAKQLVSEYHIQLQEQATAQQEAAEEAARRAAEEAAAVVEAGRPRVEAREAARQAKLEQQEALRQARAEDAALRQQRLQQLAASVAPKAAADPARLLAQTEAGKAQQQPQGAAFRNVHGYTTQQLVQDQRFRVLEALGAAGLRNAAGAAMALAAVPGSRPTRPDNLTTMQRASNH